MFILGLLLIGLIYRLRVAHISRRLNVGFNERLAERTRVARELHDTFLQTVQGSKMVADHALRDRSDHPRMVKAMEQLSDWLGQATQEGREALNSLRSSVSETNDLVEALRRATETCEVDGGAIPTFSLTGQPKNIHPIVRDEVYRIGYEAIRNACAHSVANNIEVELLYGDDLVIRVKDDGKGMSPQLALEGREGHFGLLGMHERAERIGANLAIDTVTDAGTVLTLIVPGEIAFGTSELPS
jgi:signal transduction histidine kinase